jgi:hypothetical protein
MILLFYIKLRYFQFFLILSYYAISQKKVKTVGMFIKKTVAINHLVKSNMLIGYQVIITKEYQKRSKNSVSA